MIFIRSVRFPAEVIHVFDIALQTLYTDAVGVRKIRCRLKKNMVGCGAAFYKGVLTCSIRLMKGVSGVGVFLQRPACDRSILFICFN